MATQDRVYAPKVVSPRSIGPDDFESFSDSLKIPMMQPPPFELLAGSIQNQKDELNESEQELDSSTYPNAKVDDPQFRPRPKKLRTKRHQKSKAKRGKRQLSKGVSDGDHYRGDKTGVGFPTSPKNGKKANGLNTGNVSTSPEISLDSEIDSLIAAQNEMKVLSHEKTNENMISPQVNRSTLLEIPKLKEELPNDTELKNDDIKTTSSPIDSKVNSTNPKRRDSGNSQSAQSRTSIPQPLSLSYNNASNPWSATTGAISDLDGTLRQFLQGVVRQANGARFTSLSIQVNYLPANWATFSVFQDAPQRGMLQVSSQNAAINMSAQLRSLGLRNSITVTVLNNPNVNTATTANGVRFGAGAPSIPAVIINLR